jgi:Ig-like domain-containing protein
MATPADGPARSVRVFGTHQKLFSIPVAAICLALFAGAGCGGGSTSVPDAGTKSPVTIATQPASQTVAAGQTATFGVVATGAAPMTYQWRKNGVNIAGATASSYTTPPAAAADNAAKFVAVVSNPVGSVTSNAAILTVTSAQGNGAPQITTQPASQSVPLGQTATFTVAATGAAPLTYQWQKNGTAISGANSASYTTPATASADNGAKFMVVISNPAGSATSAAAVLTVTTVAPAVASSNVDVMTYHYDAMRSGANTNETVLTPANVNSTTFGLLGSFTVDGKVDGQPLYLSNVSIAGGRKNVLYAVTEHDTVFAFDADSVSGSSATALWHSSMLAAGETPSDDRGCGQVTPEIGITSTPVIDRTRNAIYVVAVSKTSGGNYIHRIHALDLTTGAEVFGGPTTITATYPGSGANSSNGNVVFDPKQYNERPGLLQVGGTIFTTWGSHCDAGPYSSWVMAYNADTLQQSG